MSTLGLLETVWLTRNDARFINTADAVDQVEFPTSDNLRQASTTAREADHSLSQEDAVIARRRAYNESEA